MPLLETIREERRAEEVRRGVACDDHTLKKEVEARRGARAAQRLVPQRRKNTPTDETALDEKHAADSYNLPVRRASS